MVFAVSIIRFFPFTVAPEIPSRAGFGLGSVGAVLGPGSGAGSGRGLLPSSLRTCYFLLLLSSSLLLITLCTYDF